MKQAERRAATTERLLDAAADVFARRGFHAATLDEVAAEAGYTKGAVYSNFDGKDGLFLALLDRHLQEQLAAIERLATTASRSARRRVLRARPSSEPGGGSFGLLMLEFWLYAARNPAAKAALADRYRRVRERLAAMIAERGGATSPGDAAALVLALDAGLFLQQLIDPDAVDPELRANAINDVIDGAGRS